MIQPWFTQEVSSSFVFFSFFALLAVLEVWVGRGLHRRVVTSALAAGAVVGAILLVLAVVAGVGGQPQYVLVALGVPGVVLSIVFAATLANVPARYATAELRRMASREI
jgi:hypothetical protein